MLVDEGRKAFPSITGFQRPGRYEIRIDFSEPDLESLTLEIDVRECNLGEFVQEKGTLCVLCSGYQYNFDPSAPACQPCPENGNCTTHVIQPIQGHWHRTPCSRHVQQCVSREACDFVGREDDLKAVASDMETCELSETSDRNYSQAQCKEVMRATTEFRRSNVLPQGYTAFLCGSCAVGYGRSWSFACDKCHDDFKTAMLLTAPLLVLLLLSGFAIRGNLNTRSADLGQSNRISRRRRLVPSNRRLPTDVQGNFEMVEMRRSGVMPPEIVQPDLPASTSANRTSSSDPEVAKLIVVEIFKARVFTSPLPETVLCRSLSTFFK